MPEPTKYVAKTQNADGTITYTGAEDAVWRDLVAQQMPNITRHAAQGYLDGSALIDLPHDRVPQCCDISRKLRELTGWQVQPVPSLIGFKRFFGMLAERTFPAASFIRTRGDFHFSVEPDIFHEIFGHAPLLADTRITAFSEAIGKAGLAVEPCDYAWLIRLYWFTIEVGLIRENGQIKALGSALASSPTELLHAVKGADVVRKPFDVIEILRTPYRIDISQPLYFVLEDVDQLLDAAQRDLAADVRRARKLGLHAPLYPAKEKAELV